MKTIIQLLIPLGCIALTAFFVAGMGEGAWQNPFQVDALLMQIRLPRIISAILVGAALAASGAALQALFQNPLADPSLIGTSGGAAIGIVSVIALGFGYIGVPFAAFLGSFLACLLILIIHRLVGGGNDTLLVLGFVFSAICGSVVSFILFMSDDTTLRSAMTWLSGSLAEAGFVSPLYAGLMMGMGWVILLAIGRPLDCLMLGNETAQSMGINIALVRTLSITGAALMTSAAVALGGIIGFIGMMIPNLLTRIIGGQRSGIIALSTFWGAWCVLLADTFARRLLYPIDLPVGIIISMLGGPFFLWLFVRRG